MRNFLYYIVLLFILVYVFLNFYNVTVYLSYFNMSRSIVTGVTWVGYIPLLIILLIFLYFLTLRFNILSDKFSLILILIVSGQFLSNYLNSGNYKGFVSYVFLLTTNILPLFVYLFFLNTPIGLYNKVLKFFKVSFFVFLAFYIYYWNMTNNAMYRGEGFASFNNAYYLPFLLPFFLLKKNKYNNILIFITLIVVISSMKRGGNVAYILAIIFYFITILNKTSQLKKLFLIIFSLLAITLVLIFVNDYFENALFDRFINVTEDKGSSRASIFDEILNNYLNFDFINLLFGKGENISILLNSQNLTSHNDYIEILVSYGIFGLFLYFLFFYYQFKFRKNLLITRDTYSASVLTYLFVLTLFLMLVSHVIIYPLFILYIITLSLINFKKHNKNENRIISIS